MADTSTRGRGKVAPKFAAKGGKSDDKPKKGANPFGGKSKVGKAKDGKKSAPPWMQKFAAGGCVMPKSKMFESTADYQRRAYAELKDCETVTSRSAKEKPAVKAATSNAVADYASGNTTKKRLKDLGE